MTESYRELLIGCGRSREKRVTVFNTRPVWQALTTLDIDQDVDPDIWCDLNASTPWWGKARGEDVFREMLPDYWDEIHAYDVLEHLGSLGDAAAFFAHFSEIWRLLKPGGYLAAIVPSRKSGWLWGDPSHRRAIVPESLTFLDQEQYVMQRDVAKPRAMSDFRKIYKADFKLIDSADNGVQYFFVLQAVKPSRYKGKSIDVSL